MSRKRLQYFIFNKNKRPLYINDDGAVEEGTEDYLTVTGEPAHVKKSPQGWKDTLVKYGRNISTWGTLRSMTVPMKYPDDGRMILKQLLGVAGVETIAYAAIMKLNEITLPYTYENWFISEIDFSEFEEDESFFTVPALDGGMSKIYKAFEKTEYEIDIDSEPTKQKVLLDGISLHMKQEYAYIGEGSRFGGSLNQSGDAFVIPVVKKNPDGLAPYVSLHDTFQEEAIGRDGQPPNIYGYMIPSMNVIADLSENSPTNVDVLVEGRVSINMVQLEDNRGPIRIRLYQVHKDDTVGPPPKLDLNRAVNVFNGEVLQFAPQMKSYDTGLSTYDVPFSHLFDMKPGDKIFYVVEYYPLYDDDKSLYEFSESSTLTVSFKTKYAPTYVWGLYVYRLAELLIDKMIEDQFLLPVDGSRLRSVWLSGKRDLIITSGNALRQIEGSKIKTSLNALYQSMFHYSCGLSVDADRITIEPWSFFFRDELMIDLGEVDKARMTPAKDLMFNTFKVGGPTVDYDDVNGKYESNQTNYFSLPISRVIAEKDLSSPWRKDPYGIEFIRIKLEGADTTDNASDNDTFMILIEPNTQPEEPGIEPYHKLLRLPYNSITGVPSGEELFNIELSPKWTIINNGPYLSSIADKLEDRFIKFNKADKNSELRTLRGFQVVDEDLNEQVGNYSKTFRPYYFYFSTKVPLNLTEILGSDPYGKVRFTVNGRPWTGYLFDGGIKPADNDKQDWKLLCCKENIDLTKFYIRS